MGDKAEELHTDLFAAYDDAAGSARELGYEVRTKVMDPNGPEFYKAELWFDGMLVGYATVTAA